jgi:hypothetical protein
MLYFQLNALFCLETDPTDFGGSLLPEETSPLFQESLHKTDLSTKKELFDLSSWNAGKAVNFSINEIHSIKLSVLLF